jgi:hypothetical protein
MSQAPNQQTLAHVTHVSGRGYWSGQKISLTFLPADAGEGIRFRRIDLPGKPEIPALASTEATRCYERDSYTKGLALKWSNMFSRLSMVWESITAS